MANSSRSAPCLRGIGLLLLVTLLGACAGRPPSTHPADPLEDLNRANFALDQKMEHTVVQPVARVYVRAVPKPVRIVIHNFFSNLRDPLVTVNELLEGRWRQGGEEFARFAVNTTFGVLGAFDVAGAMGLHRHHADAGLTLAHWGLPEGPYLVLPLLGPTTLRGAFGKGFDAGLDPLNYDPGVSSRNALTVLEEIDEGASIRTVERLLSQSFDPYVMARQAYMSHRRYRYYHGNPPIRFPGGSGGGFPPPAGGKLRKGSARDRMALEVLSRAVAEAYPVLSCARAGRNGTETGPETGRMAQAGLRDLPTTHDGPLSPDRAPGVASPVHRHGSDEGRRQVGTGAAGFALRPAGPAALSARHGFRARGRRRGSRRRSPGPSA